jgi:hypothetical protein
MKLNIIFKLFFKHFPPKIMLRMNLVQIYNLKDCLQ